MNRWLLLIVSVGGCGVLHAATPRGVPFYRPRGEVAAKPRQGQGPVVVNAASFLPGVSPGALATVFGENLSDVTGTVVGGSNPLPTVLAGVSVTVNGFPAGVFSVAYANGEDQISFQVPWETPTGPAAADIQVFDYGVLEATITVDSFSEDPGIFTYDGTYAVAQAADGSLIGPDNPAIAGEVIVLYTTGLGPVTVTPPDAYAAPFSPLAYTEDPFTVLVNNEPAQVFFSGLTPGFVGLYQINLTLPADLPPGDLNIQITSAYASSEVDVLSVR